MSVLPRGGRFVCGASWVAHRMESAGASPLNFYRGAAALMAAELTTTPTSGIRVQACGDAHLKNFGGFPTPVRNVIFDINDLDETLPAPFEWDLKRLAASVVMAAQHLELEPAPTSAVHATGVKSPPWSFVCQSVLESSTSSPQVRSRRTKS